MMMEFNFWLAPITIGHSLKEKYLRGPLDLLRYKVNWDGFWVALCMETIGMKMKQDKYNMDPVY